MANGFGDIRISDAFTPVSPASGLGAGFVQGQQGLTDILRDLATLNIRNKQAEALQAGRISAQQALTQAQIEAADKRAGQEAGLARERLASQEKIAADRNKALLEQARINARSRGKKDKDDIFRNLAQVDQLLLNSGIAPNLIDLKTKEKVAKAKTFEEASTAISDLKAFTDFRSLFAEERDFRKTFGDRDEQKRIENIINLEPQEAIKRLRNEKAFDRFNQFVGPQPPKEEGPGFFSRVASNIGDFVQGIPGAIQGLQPQFTPQLPPGVPATIEEVQALALQNRLNQGQPIVGPGPAQDSNLVNIDPSLFLR